MADREELKRQIAEVEKAKLDLKEENEANTSTSDVEVLHEAEENLRHKPTFLKKSC